MTASVVAAPGLTVIPVWEPVTVVKMVSVAVIDCEPDVLRLPPLVNVEDWRSLP